MILHFAVENIGYMLVNFEDGKGKKTSSIFAIKQQGYGELLCVEVFSYGRGRVQAVV